MASSSHSLSDSGSIRDSIVASDTLRSDVGADRADAMIPASIEIAIPEGVSLRLALEWGVERFSQLIDALDEPEDRERTHAPEPSPCRLVFRATPTEIGQFAAVALPSMPTHT
jgi:hypothetical protein